MFRHLSSTLLLAIMMLMGVGLVQVYSASFVYATESYGDGLYFFKRQLAYAMIAFFVLIFSAQISLKFLEKYSWTFWILAFATLVLTFVPGIGVRVGGAIRWIQLPFGVRFEPSELLKLTFTLIFASILTKKENLLGRLKPGWLFLILTIPLLLLLKQPDFGSFAIIVMVGVLLLFSFGLHLRLIALAVAVMIPAFYFLVMTKDYRRARIMAFLDPWSDPAQKGFQVIQSMLSFSSGGFAGAGLGQGQGKLFFLPEAHTDFTMAVFGEEAGFIGFVMIMILYGFIILRGFQISIKCSNKFLKAVSLGFSLTFALNVFINVGVVIGLLPTKGLTLPFLSYGGSSLVALCLMFGILINIERSLIKESESPFHKA